MGKVNPKKPTWKEKHESKTEQTMKGVASETKSIKKRQRKKNKKNVLKPEDLISQVLADEDDAETKPEVDPLQGFKVVKWKTCEESDTIHHLFVKKHIPPIAESSRAKPVGRTLLCHNVPPFLKSHQIEEIFNLYGKVEHIFVHQKPSAAVPAKLDMLFPLYKDQIRGFKVAYVVFSDAKVVDEIMAMDLNDVSPAVLSRRPKVGIIHWISQYNRKIVPVAELEKSVKKFMENFDKEEVKRKETEKNMSEADSDGWVTVTRTGKRASGGLVRSETMEERLRAKKRRQDKELLNITPAQVKESKMKQMIELRKKFEEDKQRIALMKQQRKFKPF